MKLDIADVAFQGFRQIWKKPWVVLVWAVTYVLGLILIGGAAFATFYFSGQSLLWGNSALGIVAFILIIAAAVLVFTSVSMCAAYRLVLRPDEGTFAYLRLGWAELRLSLLILVFGIVIFVVAIVLSLLVNVMVAIVFFSSASSGANPGVAAGASVLVSAFIVWAIIAVFLVRFSLAPVINFAEGRFGLLESWDLTRGNFWRLFAVYLILFVYFVVVAVALNYVSNALTGGGAANPWNQLIPQAAAPITPMTPEQQFGASMIFLLVQMFVGALNTLILYAPHAAAYRQLHQAPPEATSEVFS